MHQAWIILVGAGLLEIVWAWCIKRSDGCRHVGWTTVGLLVAVISIVALAQAMRRLPVSTSYAVWAGIGAAGTALAGMLFFREEVSLLRLACLGLILCGIVGLRWAEGGGDDPAALPTHPTLSTVNHLGGGNP